MVNNDFNVFDYEEKVKKLIERLVKIRKQIKKQLKYPCIVRGYRNQNQILINVEMSNSPYYVYNRLFLQDEIENGNDDKFIDKYTKKINKYFDINIKK